MGQVVAAVASASPCGHRAVEARRSLRQQQREARIQASKEEFSSDEDEDGIWKAWGASGELRMADGKPFSSGTEAEQDGREFETAMRDLLGLEAGDIELWNMTQASVEALQKAHKRLPRDLASLQCTRTLPNEPKSTRAMRSEVDGAGTIRWQILDRCDWIVRPSSIDGDRSSNVSGPFCVVEMSINAKPFALKIYQLGKIAFMLSQGAKWKGKKIEVNKLFYIVITNRAKPILQPDKLLRRYSALNQARADGRFGVIHVSKYFGLGGSAQPQTKQVWVRQLRKDGAGGFKFAGNAFKVIGAATDIDELKKAIKKENPATVLCDPFQIDIYLQQEDGGWTMQTRMGASLRETDEDDVYGYVLP